MPEKRYFKVFYNENNVVTLKKYIVLFDAIAGLAQYDDDALEKTLKKKGLNIQFLSADKNYLYQLILKSLTNFHSGKSINILLNEFLTEIEILFYKGQTGQCIKIIEKGIGLALSIDNFNKLIELLVWKRKCIGYSKGITAINDINKSIEHYAKLSENLSELNKIYFQISAIRQESNKARSKTVIDKIERILKKSGLKRESKCNCISAKIKYHQIYSQYFYIKNDKSKELNHSKSLINILKENNEYKLENPLEVVAFYSRYISLVRDLEKDNFLSVLSEFKTYGLAKSNSQIVRNRTAAYSLMSECTYYINQYQFSYALETIEEYKNNFSASGVGIDDSIKMTIQYLMAFVYFSFGNKKESLKHINTILNEYTVTQRPDLHTWTNILNLAIHFEYGDFEYLRKINVSTSNYFIKYNKLYNVEKSILGFFKSIEKKPADTIVKNNLKMLIDELEVLKHHHYEKNAFNIFDFTIWANSILKRTTIVNYLKRN